MSARKLARSCPLHTSLPLFLGETATRVERPRLTPCENLPRSGSRNRVVAEGGVLSLGGGKKSTYGSVKNQLSMTRLDLEQQEVKKQVKSLLADGLDAEEVYDEEIFEEFVEEDQEETAGRKNDRATVVELEEIHKRSAARKWLPIAIGGDNDTIITDDCICQPAALDEAGQVCVGDSLDRGDADDVQRGEEKKHGAACCVVGQKGDAIKHCMPPATESRKEWKQSEPDPAMAASQAGDAHVAEFDGQDGAPVDGLGLEIVGSSLIAVAASSPHHTSAGGDAPANTSYALIGGASALSRRKGSGPGNPLETSGRPGRSMGQSGSTRGGVSQPKDLKGKSRRGSGKDRMQREWDDKENVVDASGARGASSLEIQSSVVEGSADDDHAASDDGVGVEGQHGVGKVQGDGKGGRLDKGAEKRDAGGAVGGLDDWHEGCAEGMPVRPKATELRADVATFACRLGLGGRASESLRGVDVGSKEASAMVHGLRKNGDIQVLDLSDSTIHGEAAELLSSLLGSEFVPVPKLRSLVFARCPIGDTVAEMIWRCLSRLAITSLDMRCTLLSPASGLSLSKALIATPTSHLQLLNLSGNSLLSTGATHIASALAHCSSLVDLNLDGNGIDDSGATKIADGLSANTGLHSLHLANNEIGNIGGMALAQCWQSRSVRMRLIDLCGNKVTGKALVEIEKVGRLVVRVAKK